MAVALPTTADLTTSLSALSDEVYWRDRWLLIAQYRAPSRALDEDELARATRRERGLDARLAYGRLAKRIGEGAGWRPAGQGMTWTAALSDTVEVEGRRCLRLRTEAAQALERSGWVRAPATTDLGALVQGVDDLMRVVLFLVDEVVSIKADLESDRTAARPPGQRFNWAAFDDRLRIVEVTHRMALDRARAFDVFALVDHWTQD